MAGTLTPAVKRLLDTLRGLSLPGPDGEAIRVLIDQVEAEVSDLVTRAGPPEAP